MSWISNHFTSHSDPAVAGKESRIIFGSILNGIDQRCFAKPVLGKAEGLNMTSLLA